MAFQWIGRGGFGSKAGYGDIGEKFGQGLSQGMIAAWERKERQKERESDPRYIEGQMRLQALQDALAGGKDYFSAVGEAEMRGNPLTKMQVDTGYGADSRAERMQPWEELGAQARNAAINAQTLTLLNEDERKMLNHPYELEGLGINNDIGRMNLYSGYGAENRERELHPYSLLRAGKENTILDAQVPLINAQTENAWTNAQQTREQTRLMQPQFDWQKTADQMSWDLKRKEIDSQRAYYIEKAKSEGQQELFEDLMNLEQRLSNTETQARRDMMDYDSDPEQSGQLLRGLGNTYISTANNLIDSQSVSPETVMTYAQKGVSFYLESIQKQITPELQLSELQASTQQMKAFRQTRPEIWKMYLEGLAALRPSVITSRDKIGKTGIGIPFTKKDRPSFDPIAQVASEMNLMEGLQPGGVKGGVVFTDADARAEALRRLLGR